MKKNSISFEIKYTTKTICWMFYFFNYYSNFNKLKIKRFEEMSQFCFNNFTIFKFKVYILLYFLHIIYMSVAIRLLLKKRVSTIVNYIKINWTISFSHQILFNLFSHCVNSWKMTAWKNTKAINNRPTTIPWSWQHYNYSIKGDGKWNVKFWKCI